MRWRGGAALLVLLTAACGAGGPAGPPAILYGQDICDHCRMVISEERHAAAARLEGAEHRFDDPGCLIDFLAARPEAPGGTAWVHDEERSWLEVEDAWFARDPQGGTPMGSGILAFGSRRAAAGANSGGEPRRWSELEDGN